MSNCLDVQQLLRLIRSPPAAPGKTTAADLPCRLTSKLLPLSRCRASCHPVVYHHITAVAASQRHQQTAGSPTTSKPQRPALLYASFAPLCPSPLPRSLTARQGDLHPAPPSRSLTPTTSTWHRDRLPDHPAPPRRMKNLARKPTTPAEILLIVSDISLRQLAPSWVYRSVEKKSEKNHLESP